MLNKRYWIFFLCFLLALCLGGCGNNKAQSAVSKLGDEVSGAVSRVESALDSMLDGDASGGNLDSDLADDGVGGNGDESLGDGEYGVVSGEDPASTGSGLADGGDRLDGESSALTKDR